MPALWTRHTEWSYSVDGTRSVPTTFMRRGLVMTSVETQVNVPVEIVLATEAERADPGDNVEVDVLFTEPDETVRCVPAFRAGEGVWKVRYATGQPGTHSFASLSRARRGPQPGA